MSDWRTNPRQGRSLFLPLLDDIKKRLSLGETIKMIFESYPEIKMSYPQFTRYIKKYCGEDAKPESLTVPVKQTGNEHKSKGDISKEPSRNIVRNPSDLRKLRNQPIDLDELEKYNGDKNESSDS